MRLARWSLPLALVAVAVLPAASAQAAECPPGSPTLVVMVNGNTSGPVYTTRDLLVRVRLSGGAFYTVNSFDVTGLRRVPHPDGDESPINEFFGIADAPGTLAVTATLTNEDAEPSCTVSGTVNFEIRQATAPIVSNLRKPPPFKGHRGWLWDSKYWFWVKPGPTGNVSPITVEARAIRRARIPGPGVPAKRITFPMRVSDGAPPEQEPHGGCGSTALICPRKIRTWPNGRRGRRVGEGRPDGARPREGARHASARRPDPPLQLAKTPVGVDVKVLQDGAPIARLRMAGRCDP